MSMIRNIIFDFGGVIYDIDFQCSMIAFQKLGMQNFDRLYSKAIQDKLFERLETDAITLSEFRDRLRRQLGEKIGDDQIDKAWNALLIGFRPERLKLLNQVKSNYNIFLLSNTNRIHYQKFLKEFQTLTGYQSFDDLFRKSYFSFNIKYRKPDVRAYRFVLEDAGLNPKETLFIDDSFQNIQPAKDLGMRAIFLDVTKGENIIDLFQDRYLQ